MNESEWQPNIIHWHVFGLIRVAQKVFEAPVNLEKVDICSVETGAVPSRLTEFVAIGSTMGGRPSQCPMRKQQQIMPWFHEWRKELEEDRLGLVFLLKTNLRREGEVAGAREIMGAISLLIPSECSMWKEISSFSS
jgi:hypothetical protein